MNCAVIQQMVNLNGVLKLERVWKMLSAKWGVQIAGMILGARSSIGIQEYLTVNQFDSTIVLCFIYIDFQYFIIS